MNTKICKQCGELKPIDQFRKYYGGRKGTYKTCKLCEKINARCKYLKAKGDLNRSDAEHEELLKIFKLYEAQRAVGLQPPREQAGRNTPLVDSLDAMIGIYTSQLERTHTKSEDVPAELLKWLSCDLTEEPDYYLDEVYEELRAKYRPALRIDKDIMQPVYDDTHKETLDAIISRFYEYEDTYYDRE